MRRALTVAAGLLGLSLGMASMLPGQVREIAPCLAIRSEIASRADRCIPVPDTTVTPPDTVTPPTDTAKWARSMGLWTGKFPNACPKAMHDAYSAVGPDGKRYPVWHPPVDSIGGVECYYEHEHRDNPALSALDSLGPMYFGYVNEQGCEAVLAGVLNAICRFEDHFGHKVEVSDTVLFEPTAAGQAAAPFAPIRCNVLTKMHQGTHSPDAFTNNVHEQEWRIGCGNGWLVSARRLSAIGKAGTMTARCSDRVVTTGAYVPENSPLSAPNNPGRSMGHRFVPSHTCVDQATPDVHENWKTQNVIMGIDSLGRSREVFRVAFYWFIANPSRIWTLNGLRRTIEICFDQSAGQFLVKSRPCSDLRKGWDGVPIPWDDPRSPFKGDQGSVRFNDIQFSAAGGPVVFYTDALGENPSAVLTVQSSVPQYVNTGFYRFPLGGSGGSNPPSSAVGVRGAN